MDIKKILRLAKYCGFVLSLIGFVLITATPVLVQKLGILTANIDGLCAIWGKDNANLAWTATMAWVLILVVMIDLVTTVIYSKFLLPGLKKKQPKKYAKLNDKYFGIMYMFNGIVLIICAILLFTTKGVFISANNGIDNSELTLGAGWIVGAILEILGGASVIASGAVDVF